MEVIEGFEVAVAAILEKMFICEFYSGIFNKVSLASESTESNSPFQSVLDSALPELYAAVIVFSVKARTYFETKGMYTISGACIDHTKPMSGVKNVAKIFKTFDVEFLPFIEDIHARERAIREYADAATMERIRSKYSG